MAGITMNTNDAARVARLGILALVQYRKPQLMSLFSSYGIVIPPTVTTDELHSIVLKAVKDNPSFRQDLKAFMHNELAKEASGTMSADGTTDLSANSIDNFLAGATSSLGGTTTTSNAPATTTAGSTSKGGFFQSDTFKNLFNTGLNILQNQLAAKSNQTSEKNAIDYTKQQTNLEAAKAHTAVAQAAVNQAAGSATKSKTGVIIGVVALVVVGLIVTSVLIFRNAGKGTQYKK